MRHQKSGRKFGRTSASRNALMSNLVAALIEHEHIRTTDAKAKELRKVAERTISWATSVGKLVEAQDSEKKVDAADSARVVHAMRMARRVLHHGPALSKLFHEVGPRLMGRPGGFTRIMKLHQRAGDAAPISIIELVDRAAPEPEADEADAGAGKTAGKAAKPAKAKAAAADAGEAPKAKAKKPAAAKPEKPAAKSAKPASPAKKKAKKDEE